MRTFISATVRRRCLVLLAAMSGCCTSQAAVTLQLTEEDATPGQVFVVPGGSFSLLLRLTSTAEQTTGVNYFLTSDSSSSGFFTIVDRNITGSPFNDPQSTDAVVESTPNSTLSPRNANNLGASVANANSPNSAGAFVVARFTLSVVGNAVPGNYSISTISNSGTGYTGAGPDFEDRTFDQQGMISVAIVPEPSALLLVGLGLSSIWTMRRSRSTPLQSNWVR